MERNFRELLEARWAEDKFVCVGLDTDPNKIPKHLGTNRFPEVFFNRKVVEATVDLVCAFKPNSAFYEGAGDEGCRRLFHTAEAVREIAPSVPVILDAKRGDIGSTNVGYVEMAFNFLRVDAITAHPYLGREALAPFLKMEDKGIIVLCRTSNPGAGEFQDLTVIPSRENEVRWKLPSGPRGEQEPTHMPLYQHVAHAVANDWNGKNNCGVVVGATYPEELKIVRGIVGDMPF